MQILQRDRQSTRLGGPILGSRKLRLALLGVALAAALLYFSPRLGLHRMLAKLMGTDSALLLVIVLLVGIISVGIVAMAYGFGADLASRRTRHRDLRSR